MHDFIRYEIASGRIVGHFRVSDAEYAPRPPEGCAHVELTDPEAAARIQTLDYGRFSLGGLVRDGVIESIDVVPRYTGHIELTSDLEDRDGDGVVELPADGAAEATITARLVGSDGRPVKGDVAVSFQVSRGVLSSRQVQAEAGVALVTVRSIAETVVVRVTASAPDFQRGTLDIEIIPPAEFAELRGKRK